jgi:hypothetical protein
MVVKTFSSRPLAYFSVLNLTQSDVHIGFPSKPWNRWTNCWDHPNCILTWTALNCSLSLDSRQSCKDALDFLRPTLPCKLSSLNVFKLPVVHWAMHITFVATRKLGTTNTLFLAWFNTNKREEFKVCNESSSWQEWIRNLQEETRGDRLRTLVLLS